MKKLIYIMVLVLISCSGNRVDRDKAFQLYEVNYSLVRANERLGVEMNRALREHQRFVDERMLQDNAEFKKSQELVSERKQFQGFIAEWKTNMINVTGGMDEYGLPMGWNKRISWLEAMPENDFNLEVFLQGELNVMVGLSELSRIEYEYISKLYQEQIQLLSYEMESDYRLDLVSETISNYGDTKGVGLHALEYLPYEIFLINGSEIKAPEGYMSFTKQEWDEMRVEMIEVPLRDTTLTFNIR